MMPEDDYLARVGRVVYVVGYVEWLAIEVITLLNPSTTVAGLADNTTARIARRLKNGAKHTPSAIQGEITDCAVDLARLAGRRNDVVHARPATAPDGRPRLFRWSRNCRAVLGIIDDDRLEGLVADALEINRRLNKVRDRLR